MDRTTNHNDPRGTSFLENTPASPFLPSADRLKKNKEKILRVFEITSRLQIPAAQYLDSKSFIDSLPKFLDSLVKALTVSEPERRAQRREYEIARKHGEQRSEFPVYDLNQLIQEYDILRRVLFEVLEEEEALSVLERDMILEAIYIAIRSSTDEFVWIRNRQNLEAQEQLRLSEEQLKLAIRGGKLGTWSIRFPGNILVVDEKTKELHGIQSGDEVQDVINRQFHPDDQVRVKKALENAIENGSVLQVEYRVRNSNDHYRWIAARGEPVYDTNGTMISFSGVMSDITERKHAEAQLLLEQHKLQTIFEKSPAAMALWRGPELIFEKVNPEFQANFETRQLEGLPMVDALPELRNQVFPDLIRRVFETGETYHGQEVLARLARTEGGPLEDRYYDFTYARVDDPLGKPYGVYSHAIDVTDRLLARQQLEENERQLKTYAEAMPQMAFIADEKGNIIFYNKRFYEYTGIDPGKAEGWNWKNQPIHHPDDLQRTFEAWKDAIRNKKTFQIEYRLRRSDGEYRWHLGRAIPARDKNGNVWRWYGTNTDIHEQKLLVQELEIAKVSAERANSTKSAFLANMSHEIRTPLAAILGFADLMRDPALSPEDREQFLNTISRNGKALTRIIDDILDLAKVESGKLDVEDVVFSFYELMEEVSDLFRERAKSKDLYLNLKIDPHVPERICTDPTRLRQILINIIGNALKFTDSGGITVTANAKQVPHTNDKYTFKVLVQDTGIGIPIENQERLFQPFVQADNTTTRKFGGTGLGLVLSYRLAKALGGSITIHDCIPPEHTGCTFEITFQASHPENSHCP